MNCPHCHTDVPQRQAYCHACGTALRTHCPGCRSAVLPTHNFCPVCGQRLTHPLFHAPSETPAAAMGGERKQVSVLFADLSGYTALADRLDPEDVRDITRRLFAQIATIIAAYQGVVEKFIGDAVLAIFGLPAVHEDDPVRAVRAGLEIHRWVASLAVPAGGGTRGMQMHSGIHTGLVVTGEMQLENGIHGVVGDTLNLASRLADMAKPGEILVSERTHHLVSAYFRTRSVGRVRFKGVKHATRPYRIVGERAVNTRFEAARRKGLTAFIGRRGELALLHDCLEKTAAGSGQIVAVSGEAGVGKSRLAYEFRHGIDRRRINVLQGRCQSYGSHIPYLPFINALKRGLSLDDHDTPAETERKAVANVRAIDPSLESRMPFLLHLLSIQSPAFPLPPDLRGRKLKESIDLALASLILANARRRPMVLILEDWHWVDEASASVLAHLEGRMGGYPLLVMILYRPDAGVSLPANDKRVTCRLQAMDHRHTAQAIVSIWGVADLSDALAALVHERTGGNPFFIEEVCRALLDEGAVRITGNRAEFLGPPGQLSLPDSVQAVIRARLDRLNDPFKETLQVASVIGREFSLGILQQITGGGRASPGPLSKIMAGLTSQELILPLASPDGTHFIFKHVLTQVAVYESLLLSKRRQIHLAVGRAIERLYAGRIEDHYENLAYHYVRSSDRSKALGYLERAGDKAAMVHSLKDARTYYETALSLVTETRTRSAGKTAYIELALKWADVSQYSPSNKIRQALGRALDYARDADRRDRIIRVSYWIGRFAYMQGDFGEAVPQIRHCIRRARRQNDPEMLGLSTTLLGRCNLYTGEIPAGIRRLHAGLERLRPFEHWEDIVYSTAALGILYGLAGAYRNCLKTLAAAIRLARQHAVLTFEAMAFGYLGAVQYWYGHPRAAITNCQTCIRMSTRLGNSLPVIWATLFKGAALVDTGRADRGLTIMNRSIDRMRRLDSVLALRYFYALLAEKLVETADYPRACSALAASRQLAETGQAWGAISNLRVQGLLAAAEMPPDWNTALTAVKQSVDMASDSGAVMEQLVSCRTLARLSERKGDAGQAEACRHRCAALLDRSLPVSAAVV